MTLEQELRVSFEQKLNRPLKDDELSFINWMSNRVIEQELEKNN